MKKHKNKIITGLIIIVVLAFAYLYGGTINNYSNTKTVASNNATSSQTIEIKSSGEKVKESPKKSAPAVSEKNKTTQEIKDNKAESSNIQVVTSPAKEEAEFAKNIDLSQTIDPKNEIQEEEKETLSSITVSSETKKENYSENIGLLQIIKSETPTKQEEKEIPDISPPPASSKKTETNTNNPAKTTEAKKDDETTNQSEPEENPLPVDPKNITISDKELTCTLSVRCDTILNNIDLISEEKTDIVPNDGIIYMEKTVIFYEGESVFNVLSREMKRSKIHMEFVNTPIYNSAYIEGIGNLYEFDCGELSGWMYKVNGWFPNYGCSRYQLKAGDKIEWVYTCDLGADVGGDYLKNRDN